MGNGRGSVEHSRPRHVCWCGDVQVAIAHVISSIAHLCCWCRGLLLPCSYALTSRTVASYDRQF